MSKENRRDQRVDTKQEIWIEGQEVRTAAHAGNMSMHGMFVVAPRDSIPVGATVAVNFDDDHEGEVSVRMQVVWRDQGTGSDRVGLQALDSEGLHAFQRVVSRYIEHSRPPGPMEQEPEPKK